MMASTDLNSCVSLLSRMLHAEKEQAPKRKKNTAVNGSKLKKDVPKTTFKKVTKPKAPVKVTKKKAPIPQVENQYPAKGGATVFPMRGQKAEVLNADLHKYYSAAGDRQAGGNTGTSRQPILPCAYPEPPITSLTPFNNRLTSSTPSASPKTPSTKKIMGKAVLQVNGSNLAQVDKSKCVVFRDEPLNSSKHIRETMPAPPAFQMVKLREGVANVQPNPSVQGGQASDVLQGGSIHSKTMFNKPDFSLYSDTAENDASYANVNVSRPPIFIPTASVGITQGNPYTASNDKPSFAPTTSAVSGNMGQYASALSQNATSISTNIGGYTSAVSSNTTNIYSQNTNDIKSSEYYVPTTSALSNPVDDYMRNNSDKYVTSDITDDVTTAVGGQFYSDRPNIYDAAKTTRNINGFQLTGDEANRPVSDRDRYYRSTDSDTHFAQGKDTLYSAHNTQIAPSNVGNNAHSTNNDFTNYGQCTNTMDSGVASFGYGTAATLNSGNLYNSAHHTMRSDTDKVTLSTDNVRSVQIDTTSIPSRPHNPSIQKENDENGKSTPRNMTSSPRRAKTSSPTRDKVVTPREKVSTPRSPLKSNTAPEKSSLKQAKSDTSKQKTVKTNPKTSPRKIENVNTNANKNDDASKDKRKKLIKNAQNKLKAKAISSDENKENIQSVQKNIETVGHPVETGAHPVDVLSVPVDVPEVITMPKLNDTKMCDFIQALTPLLKSLKTYSAKNEPGAKRLLSRVQGVAQKGKGLLDLQTEWQLAAQPIRSENVQLRRKIRILNQQLKDSQIALDHAEKPDISFHVVHLQLVNHRLETKLKEEQTANETLRKQNKILQEEAEKMSASKIELLALLGSKDIDFKAYQDKYMETNQSASHQVIDVKRQLEQTQGEMEDVQHKLTMAELSITGKDREIYKLKEQIKEIEMSRATKNTHTSQPSATIHQTATLPSSNLSTAPTLSSAKRILDFDSRTPYQSSTDTRRHLDFDKPPDNVPGQVIDIGTSKYTDRLNIGGKNTDNLHGIPSEYSTNRYGLPNDGAQNDNLYGIPKGGVDKYESPFKFSEMESTQYDYPHGVSPMKPMTETVSPMKGMHTEAVIKNSDMLETGSESTPSGPTVKELLTPLKDRMQDHFRRSQESHITADPQRSTESRISTDLNRFTKSQESKISNEPLRESSAGFEPIPENDLHVYPLDVSVDVQSLSFSSYSGESEKDSTIKDPSDVQTPEPEVTIENVTKASAVSNDNEASRYSLTDYFNKYPKQAPSTGFIPSNLADDSKYFTPISGVGENEIDDESDVYRQRYLYKDTPLDASLSTIQDFLSVGTATSTTSVTSLDEKVFHEGLAKLDADIARVQLSLKSAQY